MNNYSLTITHLYPKEMNIYGDMGNIIALKKRAQWRNINITLHNVGRDVPSKLIKSDIYFMGGGQDNDMYSVFKDLLNTKKDFIQSEILADKVFLLICGAFQLFGRYFIDSKNRRMDGLDLLPIITTAPSSIVKDRCLGNITTNISKPLVNRIKNIYHSKFKHTIVGFENHSGQTFFLNKDMTPLGDVETGQGNNIKQKIEGLMMYNIFATYTHGSLLPKNPHIADLILSIALKNKYGRDIPLAPLDDRIEWMAHENAVNKH